MYFVYMKLPVGTSSKDPKASSVCWFIGIIISHDFVENLLKASEPTIHHAH
jgi:hypothetical protein